MTSVFPTAEPDIIVHTEIDRSGQVVTSVIGALDASTVATFERHLETVVAIGRIDLRLVGFCSAAGVAALVRLASSSQLLGSAAVRNVIALCQLDGAFDLVDVALIDLELPDTLDHAFDRAEFGLYVMDDEHRFRYVNPSMAVIHGVDIDRHSGRRPDEIFDIVTDDSTPIIDRVLRTSIAETHLVHSTFDEVQLVSRCWYHSNGRGPDPLVAIVVQPLLDRTQMSLSPSNPRIVAKPTSVSIPR